MEQKFIVKLKPYKSPFGGFRGRKCSDTVNFEQILIKIFIQKITGTRDFNIPESLQLR